MSKLSNHLTSRVQNNMKHFATELIKTRNPGSINSDGSCSKCDAYYQDEIDSLVEILDTIRVY